MQENKPKGIVAESADQLSVASELAANLQLPVLAAQQVGWQLVVTAKGVVLQHYSARDTSSRQRHRGLMSDTCVMVDFDDKKSLFRQQRYRQELLIRACGLSKDSKVRHVVDATAGLGVDTALLACAGRRLTIVERSPYVAALLADGLQRAVKASVASNKPSLVCGDAVQLLPSMDSVDVVYLDPMFPSKQKSALPPKAMQGLQSILTDAQGGKGLLNAAMASAKYRVVVKRPIKAPALGDSIPSFVLQGKQVRFDCYALQAIT